MTPPGRHACRVDAAQAQRGAVDPHEMRGEVGQADRVPRCDRVQVPAVREALRIGQALRQISGVPAQSDDPLAGPGRAGRPLHGGGDVGDRPDRRVADVEGERRLRHAVRGSVQVGVVDARQYSTAVEFDDPGAGSCHGAHLGVAADGDDVPAAYGHALGHAEVVVHGEDLTAGQDEGGALSFT